MIKELMKIFLKQAINSIDRIDQEMEGNKWVDIQTKKAVNSQGDSYYCVNFMYITKDKTERDLLAKVLDRMMKHQDSKEFLEIGGEARLYDIKNER